MATFTKKQIVTFPFPYTNLEGKKLRPCLILSNEMKEDILFCQITSKNIQLDKYVIPLNKNETMNGTLFINSYIRSNMLFTGSISNIKKVICEINEDKYNEICNKINSMIKT